MSIVPGVISTSMTYVLSSSVGMVDLVPLELRSVLNGAACKYHLLCSLSEPSLVSWGR